MDNDLGLTDKGKIVLVSLDGFKRLSGMGWGYRRKVLSLRTLRHLGEQSAQLLSLQSFPAAGPRLSGQPLSPTPSNSDGRARKSWGATCNGKKSRNYHDELGSRLKVYSATDCNTEWALNFSVVNAAATDKLVSTRQKGYFQCQANLVWL